MSMEVYYRPSDQVTIKLDVKDVESMFQELGPLQEVFESAECGKCQCKKIRVMHRRPDKFDFYELLCTNPNCGARLSLGKNDQGNLFPRRYEQDEKDPKVPKLDANGKKVWLPNNGWVRYNSKTSKYE